MRLRAGRPVLTTERLLLREFCLADAEIIYQLNSDPEVIRYTGDPPFASVAEARETLAHYHRYRLDGYGRWPVIRQADNAFLGWCGLKLNELNQVDLGYRFFRSEWGKGYATESARGVIEYAFSELGLSKLIGRVAPENPASIRVLEKLSFEFWKKDDCKGIPDSLYYRLQKPA